MLAFERRRYRARLTVLGLAALVLATVPARPDVPNEIGLPLTRSFRVQDYRADTQNWDVLQASNGLIYVANGHGVLEYDGVDWRLVATPGKSRVRSIVEGPDGAIYLGTTADFGVLRPDERGQLRFRSLAESLPEAPGEVFGIAATDDGVLFLTRNKIYDWDGHGLEVTAGEGFLFFYEARDALFVYVNRVGLHRRVRQSDRFELEFVTGGGVLAQDSTPTAILPWGDDEFLVVTGLGGLYRLGPLGGSQGGKHSSEGVEKLKMAFAEPLGAVAMTALVLADGSVAVGTLGRGLFLLDRDLVLQRRLVADDGLASDVILAMTADEQGGLWLAHDGGITRLEWPSPLTRLPLEGVDPALLSLTGRLRGRLVASGNLGAAVLRPRSDSLRSPVLVPAEGWTDQVWEIADLAGDVLAAQVDGLHRVEIGDAFESLRRELVHDDNFVYRVLASEVFAGRLYVAGESGLGVVVRAGATWRSLGVVPGTQRPVRHLAEDPAGTVWAAGDGPWVFRVRWPTPELADADVARFDEQHGIPAGRVSVLELDDRMLFDTPRGLFDFDAGRDLPFAPAAGYELPGGDKVGRTAADASKGLWVPLRDGIVQGVRRADGYTWQDGPRAADWGRDVADLRADGEGVVWIVHNSEGLLRFDPAAARETTPADLRIRRLAGIDGETLFGGAVVDFAGLVLPAERNAVRLEFALADFNRPEAVRYRYRMHGGEWSEWSSETRKDYTNLGGGAYLFEVEAEDARGRRAAASFGFRAESPWYRSGPAYLAYAVLALALTTASAWAGSRWRTARLERAKEELETQVAERTAEVRAQARQLEEQDLAKSRFIANVSHEFRTPLTLTIGPLEEVAAGTTGPLEPDTRKHVDMALRNARRMMGLVGQVLDIGRLEAGRTVLRVARADFAALVRRTAESFESLAGQRRVHLSTAGLEEPCPLYYDVGQMGKVISNLLSNAYKFTAEGGTISVTLQAGGASGGDTVRLDVADNGRGIASEDLPHIFDRYYQGVRSDNPVQPGTGIGLALVKELVELHGGRVEVESSVGEGSRFAIVLRRGKHHFTESTFVEVEAEEPETEVKTVLEAEGPEAHDGVDTRTTVLVVDDNTELRRFLAARLSASYRVLEAADGEEGLATARQVLPDLVISDVMMPKMDGLELTRSLKSDPELAFISVILLTARATKQDTVEGLHQGADDYLAKPFDSAELAARVAGLIASRQRLRRLLQRQLEAGRGEAVAERFEDRVRRAVRGRATDSDFSVSELARELATSRAQLYRRIREHFGTTPQSLIRRARLELGAELLEKKAGTVSEVAYAVGFASHAYFSTCFREEFGVAPTAYAGGARSAPEPGSPYV